MAVAVASSVLPFIAASPAVVLISMYGVSREATLAAKTLAPRRCVSVDASTGTTITAQAMIGAPFTSITPLAKRDQSDNGP